LFRAGKRIKQLLNKLSLLEIERHHTQGTWRVLVTCQGHLWEYSLREFVDAGIRSKQIATIEIAPPRPHEAIQAIAGIAPQMATLLARPETSTCPLQPEGSRLASYRAASAFPVRSLVPFPFEIVCSL
jgi:hypothetical protein